MDPLQDDRDQSLDADDDIDATEDQLAELRRLGIADAELQGLTSEEAEEWIDELRAQRNDAGRFGRS